MRKRMRNGVYTHSASTPLAILASLDMPTERTCALPVLLWKSPLTSNFEYLGGGPRLSISDMFYALIQSPAKGHHGELNPEPLIMN